MIAVVVMTDGRSCIEDTIESLALLDGPVTRRLINDDSGDADHRAWLLDRFRPLGFELVPPAPVRQGFGGAIRHAWAYLNAETREPFMFITEDDFVLRRQVDLVAMALLLNRRKHLAQLVLRRQPWNADEVAAGGIIEQHPADFLQIVDEQHRQWVEHRRFFSTNPYLARRDLLEREWPEGTGSEGRFTHDLLRDPELRFAFWGHRGDEPWVEHIGTERVGVGY